MKIINPAHVGLYRHAKRHGLQVHRQMPPSERAAYGAELRARPERAAEILAEALNDMAAAGADREVLRRALFDAFKDKIPVPILEAALR